MPAVVLAVTSGERLAACWPENLKSSLALVPVAVAVLILVPAEALDRVTVKPSLGSTVPSPATLTVMVLLVWPAAKLSVPKGSAPPAKSAAFAGRPPLPVTAQWTLLVPVVPPERVTVKVNGVLPILPSCLGGVGRAIAGAEGSSLTMVPVAEAVVIVAPPSGPTA